MLEQQSAVDELNNSNMTITVDEVYSFSTTNKRIYQQKQGMQLLVAVDVITSNLLIWGMQQ